MIIGSVFFIDSLKVYLSEHQPFSQDGIGHLKISVGLSAPNGKSARLQTQGSQVPAPL